MMMIRYSIRRGTIPRIQALTLYTDEPRLPKNFSSFYSPPLFPPPAAADESLGTDTVVIADDSIINQHF